MYSNLCAQVTLCAQRGLACFPDSTDTLISLIHSSLAEICACARKHKARMQESLRVHVKLCAQTGPACFPDSEDTLISLI